MKETETVRKPLTTPSPVSCVTPWDAASATSVEGDRIRDREQSSTEPGAGTPVPGLERGFPF